MARLLWLDHYAPRGKPFASLLCGPPDGQVRIVGAYDGEEPVPLLLLASLLEDERDDGSKSGRPAAGSRRLRTELLAAPLRERRSRLLTFVREQAARVLELDSDMVDLHTPLKAQGMESLMSLELRDRLSEMAAEFHVVISGHTHSPLIQHENGVIFLNPGSAGPRRGNLPVSIALIRMHDGALRPEIVLLDA